MPSVCTKPPQSESALEAVEAAGVTVGAPLAAALQIVDKKVRNLEKRKAKLDGYRADKQRGKELNEDQQVAIVKYDEVLQTLEFVRDLSGQFKTLAIDEDKNRKKQNKKDLMERIKSESNKLSFALEIQDLLMAFDFDPKCKNDFLTGSNDAPKLTETQWTSLEEFAKLITERQDAYSSKAEHFSSLYNERRKEVAGSTYAEIKKTILAVKGSEYFDRKPVKSEPEEKEEEEIVVKQEPIDEDEHEEHSEENEVVNGVNGIKTEPVETVRPREYQQQQQPVPAREPIIQGDSINFLQESQIDPINMDPAVVVVQHSPPQQHAAVFAPQQVTAIPAQALANQVYVTPTTLAAMHQQQVAFEHQTAYHQVHPQQQHQHENEQIQQQQQYQRQQQQQQQRTEPEQQQREFNTESNEERKNPQQPETQNPPSSPPPPKKPQGYAAAAAAAAAASSSNSNRYRTASTKSHDAKDDSSQQGTVVDWSEEVEAEDHHGNNGNFRGRGRGGGRGNGGFRGFRKDNGYRGRSSRGNGRGGSRGSNYFRGGDREFRGGENREFRGGDREFRGTNREFRGGDREYRGGDREHRGGRGRHNGGRGGSFRGGDRDGYQD